MASPPPPFANEPVLELRRPPVRAQLAQALAAMDARLPLRVPVWIGGDRGAVEGLESTDPGAPDRVVATAGRARPEDVDVAVAAAATGAGEWAARPASERAEVLVAAAARLRERRLELAALEVRECAKPWPDADADVCEAIDFLEYYARGAVELERGPALLQAPGERNELRYVPRGVAAVMPAGMASGKFHGEITATIPRGTYRSSLRSPGTCRSAGPRSSSIAPRA